MKKLGCIFLLSLIALVCHGGPAVQWDIAFWTGGNDSRLTIALILPSPEPPDPMFPSHNVGYTHTDISKSFTPRQAVLNLNLLRSSSFPLLLQTSYGTLIDHDFFHHSDDPFFQTYDPSTGGLVGETDLVIPKTNKQLSNTVLLAFAFGYFDTDSSSYEAFVYGWIEFRYDGNDVFIVNSAATWDSGQGILAGTGTIVPEPSVALLALSGVALFLFQRRREKRE